MYNVCALKVTTNIQNPGKSMCFLTVDELRLSMYISYGVKIVFLCFKSFQAWRINLFFANLNKEKTKRKN